MDKMKRLLLLIAITLCLCPVWSQSVEYIYRNTVSSTNLEDPERGMVYVTEDGSIFIVQSVSSGAAMLDKIYTKGVVEKDTELFNRGVLTTVSASVSMNRAMASASVTSALYPVQPSVAGGYYYKLKKPFAMAGFTVDIPLSKVFPTSFTLLEDASVGGFAYVGAIVRKPLAFAAVYGGGYRHSIGRFLWGVDYSRMTGFASDLTLKDGTVSVVLGVRL